MNITSDLKRIIKFLSGFVTILLLVFFMSFLHNECLAAESCDHENADYFCEGNSITVRCPDCGTLISSAGIVNANGDIAELFVDNGVLKLYECCGDEFKISYSDEEGYLEDVCLVYGYYKSNGQVKYSLEAPSDTCRFTVHAALLEDRNNPNSAIASTPELVCELQYHRWEYSADERSLYAACAACGGEASVHLCSSGADYASRHFDLEEEYFDYEIFYQENWVDMEGIEQFYIIYDGIAANDEFNSTYKNNVFYKPVTTGNYTARIVLLKDINNPASVYLTTGEMPYYLSGMSINNPYISFVDYSYDEYQLLKEPEFKDGAYQVGTFEDLVWVAKYCRGSKNINITNDIVYNPITVIDYGESIRCGSTLIYNWLGIGNSETGVYTGNIYGNGHTIYGLYSKGKEQAGLILQGMNNRVTDLTISDAVFSSSYSTGGIAASEAFSTGNTGFENCNILNCLLYQITWFTSETEEYCQGFAGGLIGRCVIESNMSRAVFKKCVIKSKIIGLEAGAFISTVVKNYTGENNPPNYIISFSDCKKMGPGGTYYSGRCSYICSVPSEREIGFSNNDWTSETSIPWDTCGDGKRCIADNNWTVVKAADCETDGKLARLCLVCGREIESKTIEKHNHNYVFGTCLYCLAEDPDASLLSSVFSKYGAAIYIMAGIVVLSACAFVFISKNKRKKESKSE